MPETFHNPKTVAEQYGVSEAVVWSWLNSGELAGINVARSGAKKKQWRISATSLAEFQLFRTSGIKTPVKRASPAATGTTGRGRKPTPGIKKHF